MNITELEKLLSIFVPVTMIPVIIVIIFVIVVLVKIAKLKNDILNNASNTKLKADMQNVLRENYHLKKVIREYVEVETKVKKRGE